MTSKMSYPNQYDHRQGDASMHVKIQALATHEHEIDENGTEWCPASVEHEQDSRPARFLVEAEARIENRKRSQDFSVNLVIDRNTDVYLETTETITDEQAAGITFQAQPSQVRLGAFVSVMDAGGQRIGHVHQATYVEGSFARPDYVLCSIKLT